MSKRKKGRCHVTTPRRVEVPMVIPGSMKIAMGHQPRPAGCGAHGDKRLKRETTRSAQIRKSLKEQGLD